VPTETCLRPVAFSAFGCIPDGPGFEVVDAHGFLFFSNCHVPLDGKVVFRQVLNAQALIQPELRYGVEVQILEKTYDWMSLELHVPLPALEGRTRAMVTVTARASEPTPLTLGCGGVMDRGRGFQGFSRHAFVAGPIYRTVSMELQFPAFPMDEIENGRFVVALYFNQAEAATVTISDFRIDLH
jgi:hypothetical protein